MSLKQVYRLVIFSCLTCMAMEAMARSGGGGGDFSSGGDGDGDGILALLYIILHLPFPLNIIVVGVILLFVLLSGKKYRESSSLNTIQRVNSQFMSDSKKNTLLSQMNNVNEKQFIEKAAFAFRQVQKAWGEKKLSPVRRFLSDGVYQRYHAQLTMMDRLGQNNIIDHLELTATKIALIEKQNDYDIVHVQYNANISEKYVSEHRQLNQQYNEAFIEFWTFIRKRGTQHKDIYYTTSCPNCGDQLPADMGEISRCSACGTYVNMGEYDWVICEITQPEEFIAFVNSSNSRSYLVNRLGAFNQLVPGINAQLLEDKAANAYLQVRIAHALKDMNRIRRFSTDKFYHELSQSSHNGYLFNRIYLRDVSLINILENDTHLFAAFFISCKEQKVMLKNNDVVLIDPALVAVPAWLVLTLGKKNRLSAHSVLSHNCTQCGGTIGDTTDITCPYCGSVLNSEERDWIVCHLFNAQEYQAFKNGFTKTAIPAKKEEALVDDDLTARDYALNNIMVVMMADGNLSDEERDYAVRMAKKLGFNSKKVSMLWESSSAGKMGLMMPDEKKQQQKVYRLMKKAAAVDSSISPQEQAILDDVRTRYALQES